MTAGHGLKETKDVKMAVQHSYKAYRVRLAFIFFFSTDLNFPISPTFKAFARATARHCQNEMERGPFPTGLNKHSQ